MKAIELEIFNNLFSAIADEMGIVLRRSAFSPNIRERCDFSCAIFDEKGELVAKLHIFLSILALCQKQ